MAAEHGKLVRDCFNENLANGHWLAGIQTSVQRHRKLFDEAIISVLMHVNDDYIIRLGVGIGLQVLFISALCFLAIHSGVCIARITRLRYLLLRDRFDGFLEMIIQIGCGRNATCNYKQHAKHACAAKFCAIHDASPI